MKKRILILFLIFTLCLPALACTQLLPDEAASPSPESTEPPAATDAPEAEPTDEVSLQGDEPEPAAAPGAEELAMYSDFLSENYDRLSELCYGGIAGVGFIDLDLDDAPELVLFDSGASASMGVQLFDIVDENGTIECVSANMVELGSTFGGEYFSLVYVNTNYFDDFRLMRGNDGSMAFYVSSGNGSIDFSYTELISFSGVPGSGGQTVLRPASVLYRRDEYDMDSGDVTDSRCRVDGDDCSVEDYEQRLSAYETDFNDTGYTAAGVFVWADKSYSNDFTGFMSMVSAAIDCYQPVVLD